MEYWNFLLMFFFFFKKYMGLKYPIIIQMIFNVWIENNNHLQDDVYSLYVYIFILGNININISNKIYILLIKSHFINLYSHLSK